MCVWYKTFKICENATKCRLWQIDAANLSFSWLIAISWNVFMLFIEIIFKFLNMILCSKEWKCIINESSVNNWLQWLSFLQGWNTPLTDRTLPPFLGTPRWVKVTPLSEIENIIIITLYTFRFKLWIYFWYLLWLDIAFNVLYLMCKRNEHKTFLITILLNLMCV